jgi:hypothetical protein
LSWRRFLKRSKAAIALPDLPVSTLESRLVASVVWLTPDDTEPAPEAAHGFLRALPSQALFDVDERLRSWASPVFRDWPDGLVEQLASADIDTPLRHALLFLSAGHHNGHIREVAVRTLSDHPGYLTLATALIRCSDWVDQVREVAQAATSHLLAHTDGRNVVALWPLVLRLRTRERVSETWFTARVEGWMLQPSSHTWFRELLDSRHAPVRAWAFQRGLEQGIDAGIDLLTAAMGDPDPRIGLHALRFAALDGDERVREFATMGLHAAHPLIRRTSLYLLSEREGGVSRDQLRGRLCDTAAGVRSLAAYLLRERYAEDAVAIWRDALDGATDRAPLGALNALADHAQPQDAGRFRRWLADNNSMVRASALRGVLKAGIAPDDRELSCLLVQGGNRVLAVLRRHVGLGDIALDAMRIAQLVADPSLSERASDDVRDLTLSLGHWPSLDRLLRFSDGGDGVLRAWWQAAVSAWVGTSNAYAPMGPQTGAKLLLALDARRDDLSPRDYATIRSAIERH